MSRDIGFTGTQQGMTRYQEENLVKLLAALDVRGYFHHGDCIGADAKAAYIASTLGYPIKLHPPVEDKKRAFTHAQVTATPKPYLERNHDIVGETRILIATPHEMTEKLRSGTWATIRYARKCQKTIYILWPHSK